MVHGGERPPLKTQPPSELGMGDMGLKIYHNISGIYCDNDINDDKTDKSCFVREKYYLSYFTPNRVLGALLSTHCLIHTESRRAPLHKNTTYP